MCVNPQLKMQYLLLLEYHLIKKTTLSSFRNLLDFIKDDTFYICDLFLKDFHLH